MSTTRITKNDVDGAVAEVLGPYLGVSMARAAMEGHCRKLGIEGDELSAEELENLIRKLTMGLNIFVGREKSTQIGATLKTEIARRRFNDA